MAKQQVSRDKVHRADSRTYFVFVGLWSVVGIPALLLAIKRNFVLDDLRLFSVLLLILAFVTIWIRRFSLMFDETKIVYSTLFSGTNEIQLRDVESFSYGFSPSFLRDSWDPPFRFELRLKEGVSRRRHVINAKVMTAECNAAFKTYLLKNGIREVAFG